MPSPARSTCSGTCATGGSSRSRPPLRDLVPPTPARRLGSSALARTLGRFFHRPRDARRPLRPDRGFADDRRATGEFTPDVWSRPAPGRAVRALARGGGPGRLGHLDGAEPPGGPNPGRRDPAHPRARHVRARGSARRRLPVGHRRGAPPRPAARPCPAASFAGVLFFAGVLAQPDGDPAVRGPLADL